MRMIHGRGAAVRSFGWLAGLWPGAAEDLFQARKHPPGSPLNPGKLSGAFRKNQELPPLTRQCLWKGRCTPPPEFEGQADGSGRLPKTPQTSVPSVGEPRAKSGGCEGASGCARSGSGQTKRRDGLTSCQLEAGPEERHGCWQGSRKPSCEGPGNEVWRRP